MTDQPDAQPAKKKKTLKRLIHIAIFVVVGLLAWKFIDFKEVGNAIISTPPQWLAIILVLVTIDRLLMALKWWRLLRAANVPATLGTTVNAYYQASMLQYILPSSLSGDAIRAVIVTKRHGGTTAVLASMVVEKLLGILAAVILAGTAFLFVSSTFLADDNIHFVIGAIGLFVFLCAGFWLSLQKSLTEKIIGWLPVKKLQSGILKMYGHYLFFVKQPLLLAENIFLTLLEQATQVAILTCCAIAINVEAPMPIVIAAIAISQFLRKLAIVLEGWLLGETTNVAVCVALGISNAHALAFSLLGHLLNMVGSLPGAILFFTNSGKQTLEEAKSTHSQ